ncbi:sigma-70 family RNA polymerase sigma factor [Gemmata sp. G18]|uniref:Sigma-70 family RNA polymerase sigma factor n=1 Tax=Gemmata palustris TaxID=2822762 RepID=A0ABS5BZB1_9BACT|nr:sigma-70 family RNA polymerase sigma factor [Gemmata palustris]MBP3959061.1 sigma-70 family RNA polymerase sigma factor [Gemmata palustris]
MDADTPFTAVDRDLLKRCLNRDPGSWNDFVDRFLSLIYHTIGYTAHLRSSRVGPEDVEDIAAEVLLQIVANNFKVLREFRKQSSLATYLTVVARRICVHELARRQKVKDAIKRGESRLTEAEPDDAPAAQKGMESLEEVEKLLKRLSGQEKEIVRLYYLEGRTYEEISTETDVPVNTIGAVLSRARKKLRETVTASPAMPDPRAVKVVKAASVAVAKPPKQTKSKPKMEPIPEQKTETSD